MYKECKSNESAKRQDSIATAFCEMLKTSSYSDITITELCKTANLPRNTFYRYFDGKDSILHYLIEKCFTEMLEIMMQMHEKKYSSMIDYIAEWLRHYRQYDHIWNLTVSGEKHDMMLGLLIQYNARVKNSSFKQDFNNLQTKQNIFLSYGLQGILDAWKYSGYVQEEKELAKQLYQIFITPTLSIQPNGKDVKKFLATQKDEVYFVEQIYKK